MQPLFEGGVCSKKYGICVAWSLCTSVQLSLVSEYATSRRSHASSSVKSPIESSLDFPQSKMEGFQRFTRIIDSKNPRVSRTSEEEDEDNVSVISGPFEEIGNGSKATGGPQTEVAGRNSLERTSIPLGKSSGQLEKQGTGNGTGMGNGNGNLRKKVHEFSVIFFMNRTRND